MKSIKQKLYFWLLLLIIYLPFQIALNLNNKYDLASIRVLIPLFCLIIFIRLYSQKRIILKKFINHQSLFLCLFLCWSLFSLINSINLVWGIKKIIYFISIFPLYLILLSLIENWGQIIKLIKYLLFGFSFLGIIGLLQFLAQFIFGLEKIYQFWAINILPIFSGFNLGNMILNYPSWLVNLNGQTLMRAFSLLSDPHMFSFCLGLIIPFSAIGLLIYKNKLLIAIYYSIFMLGIMLSFTRGAYLGLIIALILISWLIYRDLNKKVVPCFILISLCLFILPISPVADRFYSSFDLTEGSNMGRLEMWQQAEKIGMNHFWQGIGLGNYSLALNQKDYRNPATAHNFYLDLFSEIGLIGLLLWLGLIFTTFWQLFKSLKKTILFKQKAILISLIGSLAYFSAHSLFETGIYQPIVLSLLMILMGLSQFIYHHENNN